MSFIYFILCQAFLSDPKYAEEEDLSSKLEMFKSKYCHSLLSWLLNSSTLNTFSNKLMFVCIIEKYMEFDLNDKGEIGKRFCAHSDQMFLRQCLLILYLMITVTDIMGLKRMLEKLGLAKTHLELKKMMSDVVGCSSKDTISYSDFLNMMLGKRNAILKLWVCNTG